VVICCHYCYSLLLLLLLSDFAALFMICYCLQSVAKVSKAGHDDNDDDDGVNGDTEPVDDAGVVLTSQLLAEARTERIQSRSVVSSISRSVY